LILPQLGKNRSLWYVTTRPPASIPVMVANAVYAALLIGNLLLIVASLFLGPRLLRLCRAAVFVNAIALVLMLVPVVNLLLSSHPLPEHPAAVVILLASTAPIVIEILALLAVLRWRMRPH
jgi:NADH:ubiquinone oxidoreductase subunit 6 (subunit J)